MPMSLSEFDWDDTVLIEAYDRIMQMSEEVETENSQEKKKRTWKVGNNCRAKYEADGYYYEAFITDIQGNNCTVKFIGYGNFAEVPIDSLRESKGKKSRRRQFKVSNDSKKDDIEKPEILPNDRPSSVLNNPDFFYQPNFDERSTYHRHNFENTWSNNMAFQPRMGNNFPCQMSDSPLPPPPAPPCLPIPKDSTFSAMLTSWYMAGYYTGLHQNARSPQCSISSRPHDHHHHQLPSNNCHEHVCCNH